MLKEGVLLQGRYQIIGRVGSGGMADVYKALDTKLNRYVAVKVLKREFREDKVFLGKFRTEAQSAAGLSHPNIVNVYDVGQDQSVSFIVMELIEGITLKEYIEKKGRLTVREATSIAIQVSMGLDAAHKHNIVHRDVKPQNIIISTDGKVKVTDFGIARAATSNTISSSVMGSVHYSSPEQVRGGYSDYKSDIYSLGVVMYEMVTGHVPFDGDSTVAIAIKHLQEELQTPRKYVPDLPYSLEQIILKCTQKSPDRRYANMEELIRDLKESLVNPEGHFVRIAPVLNTDRTVVISKEELERIQEGHLESVSGEAKDPGYGNYTGSYQQDYSYQELQGSRQQYGTEAGYKESAHEHPEDREKKKYRDEDDGAFQPLLSRFITAGSVIVGILILLIVILLIGNAVGFMNVSSLRSRFFGKKSDTQTEAQTETASEQLMEETQSETLGVLEPLVGETETASVETVIPDVRGSSAEEAEKALKAQGLNPSNGGEQASSEYPAGEVCAMSPVAGSSVAKGTKVTYYVSTGNASGEVPDVQAIPEEDALSQLKAAGYVPDVQYYVNENVPEGYVIYTSPEGGTSLETGSTVTVFVSKVTSTESETTAAQTESTRTSDTTGGNVQDYAGQEAQSAVTDLEDKGYKVVTKSVVDPNTPYGTIISQTIEGDTITLVVSVGAGDSPDENSATESVETFAETESESTATNESASDGGDTYTGTAAISAPKNYNGEPVRIEVIQGQSTTTVVDGSVVKFPYKIQLVSGSGEAGKIVLYILDPDTFEVTATATYPSMSFETES